MLRGRAFAALLLPLALSSGAAARDLAVYKGAGCIGAEKLSEYERFIGRRVDRVVDFLPNASWQDTKGAADWLLRCWRKTGHKLALSVPMLPRDGSTLDAGADGAYDQHYRELAALIVSHGYGDAILRLGWEFNGDWYTWAAAKNPEAFVRLWRRIVSIMREVPGARFRFDWNPVLGRQKIPPDQVYPGDDVVDIIGLDAYNQTWNARANTPELKWLDLLDQPFGLKWHREFAKHHGKPVSFPEWGTGTRPDGRGGGDDPYYVARMAEWIAGSDLAYQGYWDYAAPDYDAQLSTGRFPRAGAQLLKSLDRIVGKRE